MFQQISRKNISCPDFVFFQIHGQLVSAERCVFFNNNRKTERGRDLYDIAKLLSHNVKPNFAVLFLKEKGIKTIDSCFLLLKNWYAKNQKLLPLLKKQLQPFLIQEEELKYIDLLLKMIEQKP